MPPHDLQADKVGRVSLSYLVEYAARHDMWYLSCGPFVVPVIQGGSRMRVALVISIVLMSRICRPNNK